MVTFFTGPKINASGENVSSPTTGHQKAKSGQAFPNFFFLFFFPPFFLRGDCRYSKECLSVNSFTQTFEDLTFLC